MKIARRLRAVIGIAGTWGVAFSALATTLLVGGLAIGAIPTSIFGVREIVAVALRGLLAGGLAGTLFASVLGATERRKTLAALSTGRVALWGFLGAGAIPVAFAIALGVTGLVPAAVLATGSVVFGALGGAMGVTTVRLARRARVLTPGTADANAITPGI